MRNRIGVWTDVVISVRGLRRAIRDARDGGAMSVRTLLVPRLSNVVVDGF